MSNASDQLVVTCGCEKQVKMRVPASGMGKVFKCVQCGQRVHVTEHNAKAMSAQTEPGEPESTPAEPIGALLIEHGLVTQEQLDAALAQQRAEGGKTFEILIQLGHLDKDALHNLLSRQPGVATIELEHMTVGRELVDLIPEELATSCLVLPIDKLGRLLSVAMACPLDVATITRLEEHSGLKVKAMLAKYDVIRAAVEKYYAQGGEEDEDEDYFEMPAGLASASSAGILARLDEINALPVAEAVVASLKGLASSGQAKEFVKALGQDPALAANVMRLANSRAYGMPGAVDSVAMAVALAGSDAVVQDAGRAAKAPVTDGRTSLASRAERAALIAAVLGRQSGKVDRGKAYTAGLLVDLGRWCCLAIDPERYARMDSKKEGLERLKDEKAAMGESSPVLAGEIAALWGYPAVLVEALKHWPTPKACPGESRALAAVLQLTCLGGLAHGDLANDCAEGLSILGLRADAAAQTIDKALQG